MGNRKTQIKLMEKYHCFNVQNKWLSILFLARIEQVVICTSKLFRNEPFTERLHRLLLDRFSRAERIGTETPFFLSNICKDLLNT